jgi:hypothetical protein
MDDSPTTPQSKRRRWRRWAFVVGSCFMIGWLILGNTEEVRRARGVQLGQTLEQVASIMGDDRGLLVDHKGKSFMVYGRVHKALDSQYRRLYLRLRPSPKKPQGMYADAMYGSPKGPIVDPEQWPVSIRFDTNLRVDRIKRGREIIGAPPGAGVAKPSDNKSAPPPQPREINQPAFEMPVPVAAARDNRAPLYNPTLSLVDDKRRWNADFWDTTPRRCWMSSSVRWYWSCPL